MFTLNNYHRYANEVKKPEQEQTEKNFAILLFHLIYANYPIHIIIKYIYMLL